ncbi:MAG: hypothetical protein ACFE96_06625 [Candidatus Hermodarchaeota archaeon]
METPKEPDQEGVDSDKQKSQEFKKSDFMIAIDSAGDNFEMFVQKSADAFFDLGKNIKNWFASLKKKNKLKSSTNKAKPTIARKKTPAEQQYALSEKIYKEHKKLEKQLEKIDAALTKTQELASQIKEDTSKIKLDIEAVSVILEYQMNRIDDVEDYMRQNLGTDWHQIKNLWSEYKEGDITRGDFTKAALKKLGKNFLSIFVNVVA